MVDKALSEVQTLWFDAVKNGDLTQLEDLLKQGVEINSVDISFNTALHLATKHVQLPAMHFLITHGADVNLKNNWDSTPLHLTEKNVASIKLLLEAGADPNIKDKDYDYPYYFAFYGSMSRELTKLYIKHGAHLQFHEK